MINTYFIYCTNDFACLGFCDLRLGPKIGVWPATDKKFYFGLTVDKMHAFAAFTENVLQPYGRRGTNFMAAVNSTNPNTEIKCEIMETEINETHIYFVIK